MFDSNCNINDLCLDLRYGEYEENPLVSSQSSQCPSHRDDSSKTSTKFSRASSRGSSRSGSRSRSPHSHHSRSRSHSPADSPPQTKDNRKGVQFAESHLPSPRGSRSYDYYYDDDSHPSQDVDYNRSAAPRAAHTGGNKVMMRESEKEKEARRRESKRSQTSARKEGRSECRKPSASRSAKDSRAGSSARKPSSSRLPSRKDPDVLKPSRTNVEL
jgi:hypothetical protein